MALPETGLYTFPGGLSPLSVDRHQDEAIYLEPNVWMIHDLSQLAKAEAAHTVYFIPHRRVRLMLFGRGQTG